MFRKTAKLVQVSSMIGLFVAAACVAVSLPLHATDIAWHTSSSLTYDNPPNFQRKGTAVFKTGEKATFVSTFTYEVVDQTGTIKGPVVFQFDDGSTITMQQLGSRNVATGAVSGSGEFVSGTGRYEGITGRVTFVSQVSGSANEGDFVGSYSLARDIAWHSKGAPASWHNANYERKGTVDFKTGEQGSYLAYGTNHKVENGLTPWVAQFVFRFDDLSSITANLAGNFDPASQITKGSGEFVRGTGRFEGITGKVTFAGKFSGSTNEGDWTGSYSLPK